MQNTAVVPTDPADDDDDGDDGNGNYLNDENSRHRLVWATIGGPFVVVFCSPTWHESTLLVMTKPTRVY